MNQIWQRFVNTFGEPELAGTALLVAIGGVAASLAIFVHCLAVGSYAAAAGVGVAFSATAATCVRDYRRGRWTILSGALMVIWLMATVAALVLGIWLAYEDGSPGGWI